jgi:hypothetical protein
MPNTANAGGPLFTLTVNGSDFVNGSVVQWNGVGRTTSFVSANQLTATIPASDIAAIVPVNVTVFNPAPGGGLSNSLPFTINNPTPVILLVPGHDSRHQPRLHADGERLELRQRSRCAFNGVTSDHLHEQYEAHATIPSGDVTPSAQGR